jgi:carboxymethylenebutenolidase
MHGWIFVYGSREARSLRSRSSPDTTPRSRLHTSQPARIVANTSRIEEASVGYWIDIKAADGHELAAYRDGPDDSPHCLVVTQEIFGVNGHIRYACAQFAAAGFAVIAPALLDRVERNIELGYSDADLQRGFALRAGLPECGPVADIEAARAVFGSRKVGIIGYCWGGRVAWWGATRSDCFAASVAWYGGGIAADKDERPRIPMQMHFGEVDHSIPLTDVEAIRMAQPNVEMFVYPGAHHGFGCEVRPTFNPAAYELAQSRTLDFFRGHLGGTRTVA